MSDFTADAWQQRGQGPSHVVVDNQAASSGGGGAVTDGGGSLTVDDGGGSLTVDGTVAVSNLPGTQPVSESHLPNLDLALTALRDALRGASSKTLTDVVNALLGTLTVSGTVTANVGTGTQPVSGTVTANAGTGTMAVSLATNTPDVTDRAGRLLGTLNGVTNTIVVKSDTAANQANALKVDGSATTQPVSLATNTPDVTDRAARLLGHVTVDSVPTTPVTGTFWPATQPVSLATNTPDVTDRAARLLGHVTVDSAPTTAVTGPLTDTQLRASAVPVSLGTNTPDVTDRAARLLGHVTVDAAPTTTVTGTVTANIGTGNLAGITGTVATRAVIDTARTPIVLSATAVASVTSEAMFTLNIWKNGTVSSATSYTVTTGKTFRIQAVQLGARFAAPSTTVTFANCRFNIRSGALITSPLVYGDSKMASSNMPTPNSDLAIPDGLEVAAASVIGVSHVDSAATLLLDLLIVGYEY